MPDFPGVDIDRVHEKWTKRKRDTFRVGFKDAFTDVWAVAAFCLRYVMAPGLVILALVSIARWIAGY